MKYINEGMKIKVLDKYAEMKLLGVTFDGIRTFRTHGRFVPKVEMIRTQR